MIDDLMTLWWWRTTCRWSRDMNTSLSSYLDVTLSTWIQIVDQTWMFQPKSPFQIFSSFTLLALWGNRRETKARDEIKIKAVFHNTFVFRFWKYIASSTFHHPMTWWACFWRCFWWQCNEPLSPSQSQCWGIHISKITLQPKSKSKKANIFTSSITTTIIIIISDDSSPTTICLIVLNTWLHTPHIGLVHSRCNSVKKMFYVQEFSNQAFTR